jgi:hypothetical protein
MPRGVYARRPRTEVVADRMAGVKREPLRTRWESVKKDEEDWLRPFTEQSVEVALRYLEDLRIVCEKAAKILNQRINPADNIKCSGPGCKNDVSGTRPNGFPKYIAVKWIRDPDNPSLGRNMFFCSEICNNMWVRAQMGGGGTDGK